MQRGFFNGFESRRLPEQNLHVVKILKKWWGIGNDVEIITDLIRLFRRVELVTRTELVVEKLILTVGKISYTFDFSDIAAGVMELIESASVLPRICRYFSNENLIVCGEMSPAFVRSNQHLLAQRKRLLVPRLRVAAVGSVNGKRWGICRGLNQKVIGSRFSAARVCAWHFYAGPASEPNPKQKKGQSLPEIGKSLECDPLKRKKTAKKARFEPWKMVAGPQHEL